jgi:hypothetical protein
MIWARGPRPSGARSPCPDTGSHRHTSLFSQVVPLPCTLACTRPRHGLRVSPWPLTRKSVCTLSPSTFCERHFARPPCSRIGVRGQAPSNAKWDMSTCEPLPSTPVPSGQPTEQRRGTPASAPRTEQGREIPPEPPLLHPRRLKTTEEEKRRFRAEANRPFLFWGRSRTGPVDFIRWEDLREALRGRRSFAEPPTSGGRTYLSNTATADRKSRSCQSSPKAIRRCPALQKVFRARRASLRSYAGVNRRVRSRIDVRPGGHDPLFPEPPLLFS